MTHTTSDARKRADLARELQPPCGKCGTEWTPDHRCPSTPRVARSIDDLRVGMWVSCWMRDYTTDARTGRETWHWSAFEITDGQLRANWDDQDWYRVVILADPPAPPAADWLVPADAMTELRNAVAEWECSPPKSETAWAIEVAHEAKALLDAATEVER